MKPLGHILLACACAAFLAAQGAAQTVIIGGGGKGGKMGRRPADTVPGTTPPGGEENETEEIVPNSPTVLMPTFSPVLPPNIQYGVGPENPAFVDWGDEDDWLAWWRYQRWQRFEGAPLPEPRRAVTPVREFAEPAGARAILPKPIPRAAAADVVLPLLLEAWRAGDGRVEMRAALLIALGRVGGGPEVGAALREGLLDADLRVVEAATLAMGILREPHAIPALEALLRNGDAARELTGRHEAPPRTRAFAALALGLIAENTRYPPIRDSISSVLLETLRADDSASDEVGSACAAALGLFPGDDADDLVPLLQAVLNDTRRPERVRAAVPTSIAKISLRHGDTLLARGAYEGLARRLARRSESAFVRQSCALALGRLSWLPALSERAGEALVEALDGDSDPRVRHLAAVALGELAAAPAPAAQTIAIPSLLAALDDGPDVERGWAAFALGWGAVVAAENGRALPTAAARRLLEAFPERNSPRTRSAASLALGLMEYTPAEATLLAGLENQGRPELRAEALAALALLGGAAAREVVAAELDDLDPLIEAYQAVCAGLARHDGATILAQMVPAIDRSSATYLAQFSAAVALGWVRDPAAVEPLVRLWREGEGEFTVRVAAVTSLGRVAERPGARWNSGYLDLLNPYAATAPLVGGPGLPGVCDRL